MKHKSRITLKNLTTNLELTEIGYCVNWKRAWCYHGNCKCGCLCNKGDTCTHKLTPVLRMPHFFVVRENQNSLWVGTSHLLRDYTHTKPNTLPLEASNPAYGALCRVPHFLSLQYRSSEGAYLLSSRARYRQCKTKEALGNKQAIKADQLQGHMIHSILKWRRQRGREKWGL